MHLRIVLLNACAMSALAISAVQARAADASGNMAPAADNADADQIVVTATTKPSGGGLLKDESTPRVMQSVTQDYIAQQIPTQNVTNMLTMLPSVNTTPSDPVGIGSSGMMVRGLSQDELGWVFDGMPALTIGNGSYTNEIVDAENLEQVSLAPGTSSVEDPVTTSLAGTVYMHMLAPKETMGGQVSITAGSLNTKRAFVRFDTGELGHTGITSFVSFSYAQADNWRGPGKGTKYHVDYMFKKDFGDGNSIALEGNHTRVSSYWYYYPTMAQWQSGTLPSTTKEYSASSPGSFYKLSQTPRYNAGMVLLPMRFKINDNLSISDTPYVNYTFGPWTGGTSVTPGSTYEGTQQVDVDFGTTTADSVVVNTGAHRMGVTVGNNLIMAAKLSSTNTLKFGYWFEDYSIRDKDPVTKVNQETGEPTWEKYRLSDGSIWYDQNYNLRYTMHSVFVKDEASFLDDKLKVEAGLKWSFVSRAAINYLPGSTAYQHKSENVPIPTFTMSYSPDAHNQFYFDAEGNYRQPYLGGAIEYYSVSTGTTSTSAKMPKSEYAIKEELGWRYSGDVLVGSISVYNMHIKDRLLTLNTYVNSQQMTETVNAGNQSSRGVDLQLGTRPLWNKISFYGTLAYLRAKQLSNTAAVTTDGENDYLKTKGKYQISSPKFQAGFGINYDDGHLFAGVNLKYIGSQYSTLMNDEKVKGYMINSFSLGYKFNDIAALKAPRLQLNITNIGNSGQLIGVNSFTTNALSSVGVNGGTISGSSPTYAVQPKFVALVSLSTGF